MESREPSLAEALERVLETSQRVLLDRLELFRLSLVDDLVTALRGFAGVCVGSGLAFGAWFFLMAVVVRWLDARLPLSASLVIVALFNAVVGGVLVILGVRALRQVGATGGSASTGALRVERRVEATESR